MKENIKMKFVDNHLLHDVTQLKKKNDCRQIKKKVQ